MKLIGLHGSLESGKDTVADILVKNHGYSRISIGYHIRHEITHLRDGYKRLSPFMPDAIYLTIERLNTMTEAAAAKAVWEKPTPADIRDALQWYGAWRRSQDQMHWLKLLRQRIREIQMRGPHQRLVLIDMRMPEEYDLVRLHRGETWTVKRMGHVSAASDEQKQHITETALNGRGFTVTIFNNGTLQDLDRSIAMLVKEYSL